MSPPDPRSVVRVIAAFEDWRRLLGDYAGITKPARAYRLRSGRLLRTHGADRQDAATLFGIFGKREYGEPAGVVVDVGANIGAFSLYALSRGCEVLAFEPEPSNLELLRENASGVRIFPYALTGRTERRPLYVRDSPCHSLSRRPGDTRSVEVECKALSDVLAEEEVEHVDLLKVDVEGGEYDLLYSDPDLLPRVRTIRMEYHHMYERAEPRYRFEALREYLDGHGLVVTRWRPISHMSGIAWFARG